MLARCLLIVFLTSLAGAVQAQDSPDLKQVIQMLEEIQTEQSALRAEIEQLKNGKSTAVDSSSTRTEEATETAETQSDGDGIDRASGWLASVHLTEGRKGKVKGSLGKIEIQGFPMKHGVFAKDIQTDSPIAYRGSGELRIEEGGEHTFSMFISATKGHPICRFRMDIEGNSIFDVPSTNQIKEGSTRTWAESIELDAGFYKWELRQYCGNLSVRYYDTITWDLRVLSPSARNAVSARDNYIFFRE